MAYHCLWLCSSGIKVSRPKEWFINFKKGAWENLKACISVFTLLSLTLKFISFLKYKGNTGLIQRRSTVLLTSGMAEPPPSFYLGELKYPRCHEHLYTFLSSRSSPAVLQHPREPCSGYPPHLLERESLWFSWVSGNVRGHVNGYDMTPWVWEGEVWQPCPLLYTKGFPELPNFPTTYTDHGWVLSTQSRQPAKWMFV